MRRAAAGALGVAVSCAALGTAADVAVVLPGPAPQLRREPVADGAVRRNAGCEQCHREIAREWHASRHRRAYENPEFQQALGREPQAARGFCIGCHAPEASPGAWKSTTALGVACVTCHTPLGPVLSAPSSAPRTAPHAVLRTARLTNGDACARCHEFSFPDSRLKMQRTASEHRAVAGADVGCNGCHMPTTGASDQRHALHTFPGGHDATLVRSALKIAATRIASDHVRIVLTPAKTTHAVPTGDLFRRLSVQVTTPSAFRFERFLARHYADQGQVRQEVSDDRVYRGARVVDVYLPKKARDQPARYRVVYQRVAHLAVDREELAVLEGEILLAHGELEPKGR